MMLTHWIVVNCNDKNITQMSDSPKGVYYRETHKHTKKNDARINRCVICCLYENMQSEKHSSNLFQEFTTMSEIIHVKKVTEDQYLFRIYFKVIQKVIDEIQTSMSYIKDEL